VKMSNSLEVVAVNVREQDKAISVAEFPKQWRDLISKMPQPSGSS
jgi:hypothetical protein